MSRIYWTRSLNNQGKQQVNTKDNDFQKSVIKVSCGLPALYNTILLKFVLPNIISEETQFHFCFAIKINIMFTSKEYNSIILLAKL